MADDNITSSPEISNRSNIDFFKTLDSVPVGRNASSTNKADEIETLIKPEVSEQSKEETETEGSTETDETPSEDADTEDEEVETPTDDTEEDKVEAEAEEKPRKIKTITVKVDGEEVKLRKDGVLKHTVDGKPVSITVEELLSGFAGNQSNLNNWKAVQAERQKFQAEKDDFVEQLSEVHTVFTKFKEEVDNGQGLSALTRLLDASGLNGFAITQGIRRQLLAHTRQLLELTPEQLEWIEKQEEVAYREQKVKDYEEKRVKTAQNEKTDSEIRAVEQKYGMDRETFKSVFYQLADAVKNGSYPAKDITPEDVGKYYQTMTTVNGHIKTCIGKVNKALVNDQEVFKDVFIAVKGFWQSQGRLPDENELTTSIRHYLGDSEVSAKPNGTSNQKLSFKPKPTQLNSRKLASFNPGLDWRKV